MDILLLLLVAYILGAIPWEKWLRYRLYPGKLVLWVLLLDFFSGAVIVLIAWLVSGFFVAQLAAIFVVLGQVFSCFRRFQEQTAYAVAAGAFFILSPALILAGILFYFLSLLLTRYIILSNYIATMVVILLSFFLVTHVTVVILICLLGSFMLFRQQKHWRKRWRRRKIF